MVETKELSAGGIIVENQKVLIVLMNTINGRKVWTYPKGHIEENETKHSAALREVYEETGLKCEIIQKEEIYVSKYSFTRNGNYVKKEVFWYLMKPVENSGKILSTNEIIETKWVSYEEALKHLEYDADKEILQIIKSKGLI